MAILRTSIALIVVQSLLIDVTCILRRTDEVTNTLIGAMQCVSINYEATATISFPLCIGYNSLDVRRSSTFFPTISARGYDPSCRVLHLLLWMLEVSIPESTKNSAYVDIGAFIGSCVFHMASLGYESIAVEPFPDFVNVMKGTIAANPAFKRLVQIHQVLAGDVDKYVYGDFWHSPTNWPNTGFSIISSGDTGSTKVKMETLSEIIGTNVISIVKFRCTGCEYTVLKKSIALLKTHRIPILRIQFTPSVFNDEKDALLLLNSTEYVLLPDIFPSLHLHSGKQSDVLYPVDKLFGSKKFKQILNISLLYDAAIKMLHTKIDLNNFPVVEFTRRHADVIAIAKPIYVKLISHFLKKNENEVQIWHPSIHEIMGTNGVVTKE